MPEIMVSICCLAYNHESYVADALESFLQQKTKFQYEIIIHDDASTDRTADIIRKYEKNYPEIVKPIYQIKNQHSQKVWISKEFIYPKARGKYIALCEGDDYWIDENKLQKQIDYMEQNPECTLCFTNGQCEINGILTKRVIPWVPANRKVYKHGTADYDMGEMVCLDYIPTASLLFRRKDIIQSPEFSADVFRGDAYVRLYLTSLGYAHCIDENMCVYRFGVPNSATTRWAEESQRKIAFNLRFIALLDKMDALTFGNYSSQIQKMKKRKEYENYFLKKDYKLFRRYSVHKFYIADGASEYLKYLLKAYLPSGFSFAKKIKSAIKGGFLRCSKKHGD